MTIQNKTDKILVYTYLGKTDYIRAKSTSRIRLGYKSNEGFLKLKTREGVSLFDAKRTEMKCGHIIKIVEENGAIKAIKKK